MEKEYLWMSPHEIVRAPKHEDALEFDENVDYGVYDSYEKYGRFDVVLAAERVINNEPKKAAYNGWKYVHYARKKGIEKILVCVIKPDSDEDLVTLMVQAQRSHHGSHMALFKMIQILWPKYFKGKGYRSDLEENPEEETTDEKGRRLSVYGRIGREIFLSENAVKHIWKVGMFMPEQFERIELTRLSLYAAYLEAVKYEKQEEQEAPDDSEEVNYDGESENTSKDSEDVSEENNSGENSEQVNHNVEVTGHINEITDDEISVETTCTCCGHNIKIKISKKDLV